MTFGSLPTQCILGLYDFMILWLNGHGGVGVMVGLGDLKSLFQLKQFMSLDHCSEMLSQAFLASTFELLSRP